MKSLLWLLLSVQIALGSDYAIVVSEKTAEDKSWAKVVATLRKKHSGKIVHYEKSVREALPALRTPFPRYACFVATPHETTKDFVGPFMFLPDNWTMTPMRISFGESSPDMMRKTPLPSHGRRNL